MLNKVIYAVFCVILLGAVAYLGYQNNYLSKKLSEKSVSPAPTVFIEKPLVTSAPAISVSVPAVKPDTAGSEWSAAKYGNITFEYPKGWHVAYLWNNYAGDGVTVAIDPDPINNSPRGGPLAKFTMVFINGRNNPDELFEKQKSSFNDADYSDITTDVFKNGLGDVYYFKGKIKGEMWLGENAERYVFIYGDKKDLMNRTVVTGEMVLNSNEKYSPMFRHVVESMKISL